MQSDGSELGVEDGVEEVLGGSATYFSYSASFFTDVKLVGVVGKDFPRRHRSARPVRRAADDTT